MKWDNINLKRVSAGKSWDHRHHSLDETDKYLRGLVLSDAKNIRTIFPEI